ncbi:MAG: DNA alkylation repair protein [Acidobacteria bacterium]|nr:DNA alkylation repair protein [Acidobacteriota bacterium]
MVRGGEGQLQPRRNGADVPIPSARRCSTSRGTIDVGHADAEPGTLRIAEVLADDRDACVQKAIGSWTREAGKENEDALVRFLTDIKDRLPRSTLTAASKLLARDVRQRLRT